MTHMKSIPTQASNLPGKFYYDEQIYRQELERIFYRSWLCVGREQDIPKPGSFVTRKIGTESIIITRGSDHKLSAFYNVCRHRGAQLLREEQGQCRSIRCAYHAWTYALDGTLIGAPHTEHLLDFSKEDYRLFPLTVQSWGGFLFLTFQQEGLSLPQYLGDFIRKWEGVPLAELQRGDRIVYQVAANWKIVCENFSECYHCPAIHPELNRITYYRHGDNDAFLSKKGPLQGTFSGGWMELSGDYQSMTLTGYTDRPPLRGLRMEDRRRIYYYLVFPNLFFSLHPDYLMIHTVWPQNPTSSLVVCEWFFEPASMAAPGFSVQDAVEMWDRINRQDWQVCALSQNGLQSRAYTPGRYTALETMVHDFDAYIVQILDEDSTHDRTAS